MKQPSYDWVLFDLDETLLDFPVASALTHTLQIYGVQADDASMAQYHALNHGLWQQYNDGEIDATALQQTRFSLFAQQVSADPMAMNNTFLEQIIALSMPLEGGVETLQQLRTKVRMGIITNGFSVPQRGAARQTGLERVVRAAGDLRRDPGDQAGASYFPAHPLPDGAAGSCAGADGGG